MCKWRRGKVRKLRLTSSQAEAMSSAERCFTLSTSMIESNGLAFKGLNPVAKLEALKKPNEPHFRKSPGNDCCCELWRFCSRVRVVKECLCTAPAEEEWPMRIEAGSVMILEALRILEDSEVVGVEG